MSSSIFDVKTFGALGDGKTDDTGAFQRALDAIEALSSRTDKNGSLVEPRGAILNIPYGHYVLTKTLHIKRQMIIQGVSGAGDYAGTALLFAPDIDGVVIERQDISAVSKYGGPFGDWTVIRDLAIWSDFLNRYSPLPNPSVNEDEPISASLAHIDHAPLQGHGVVMKSRARIVNCNIGGFHYDGIYIDTVDDFKNANNFEIHNCRIVGNGRHGIFSAGTNSNAGRIFGVDCSGNMGWGIYDRSFLGNTYVGCHCADNGHFAADVRCLLVDPHTPAIAFAGTADAGVYRASDGARSWTALNRGLSVGGFNAKISALAIDSSGVIYMGTLDGGVLRLDPPPTNWYPTTSIWTPINKGLTTLTVRALAISNATTVLYAGTARGVFISVDSGKSWSGRPDRDAPPTLDKDVQALALVLGKTPIYAGTAADGVFKSIDGGKKWTSVNSGLGNLDVRALAVDPATKNTIYAGTAKGLFKSTDAAQTWTLVLAKQMVMSLAIDPKTPNTIYAGTKGSGILQSLDGGNNWNPRNKGLLTLDIGAIAIDPGTPTTVYIGTSPTPGFDASHNKGGVYRSTDGGLTWHGGADSFPADPDNAARTFYGGGYKTTSTLAGNVLVGCYSEADQVNGNELVFPTLVLGGQLGGGFNPITTAGIINQDGIANLPLRSPIIHPIQTIKREISVSPIVPTSMEQHNISSGHEVTFVDLTNGNMVLILNPATSVPGEQFVIKRIDPQLTDPANPPSSYSFEAWIEVLGGGQIDTGTLVVLSEPNSGVTLMANGAEGKYQIIATHGRIAPERTLYSTDHAITAADYIVGVDTSKAALTMTLPNPLSIADGAVLIIKDEKNNAATNSITVKRHASEKVDGAAKNLKINIDSGYVRLYTDRGNWFTF